MMTINMDNMDDGEEDLPPWTKNGIERCPLVADDSLTEDADVMMMSIKKNIAKVAADVTVAAAVDGEAGGMGGGLVMPKAMDARQNGAGNPEMAHRATDLVTRTMMMTTAAVLPVAVHDIPTTMMMMMNIKAVALDVPIARTVGAPVWAEVANASTLTTMSR
jgi:hypothetical protein